MSDIGDDNSWLNDKNQVVLEINGGDGSPHYFRPDGSEVDPRSGQIRGDADRFAYLDIKGLELNAYIDQFKLPDGHLAMTFVQWDNSELQPFDQLLLQYILFPAGPHDEPLSIYRHSNTYKFVQDDGHGNRVDEQFVDGRLRDSVYTYSDGTSVIDHFDQSGNLTEHETTGPGGVKDWSPNGDGTWTRVDGNVSTTIASLDAFQQIANDAAAHWGKGPTVAADGGNLVLLSGGLLINNNFQAIISNDGASLIGQDTAGIIGNDGASLIGNDGAGLISLQADRIISNDGASLISNDGGGLISNDGAGLISNDGGGLISNDGASAVQQFAAAFNPSGNTVGTRLVNALVFADTNFNGQFDKGEPWTITDADGHYSLPAGAGPLTLLGGTDAGTNLPFKGAMEAPVGSSIISPLTTLATELWKEIGSLEISLNTVDTAFSLSSIDLTTLDPVAGIQNGDATSASLYVAGAKVFDTVTLMAGTLNGMGADPIAAGKAIVQAMVGDLAKSGTLNLGDKDTVAALFTSAASGLGIDGSAIADSIASLVVSTNAQLDTALAGHSVDQSLLDSLAAVETHVQGSITSDLAAAAGDPNKIADIAATPPDQTPTGHSGPPKWMASVDVGAHPAGWSPAGAGDFNHDATSDLAWFNSTTGDLDIWELADGHWSASSDVGSHPAGYQPAGFGDYNHDGTKDVLWFNATTHDVDLWEMSNGKWSASVDVGAHPAGYTPVHTGDLNGDGTSDVVWYNAATRDVDIWEMSNGHWSASVDIGGHPDGYQPSVVGDFNGDHTSDIAWFNPTSGDLDIWKISNGQWAGSVDVGAHPAGYQPLGAADLNHDGTSDVVWYNPATNDVDVWLLNNGQWSGSVDLGAHPAGAVPVGLGDFDHNGVPDLAWQDTSTGHIDNWMLTLG